MRLHNLREIVDIALLLIAARTVHLVNDRPLNRAPLAHYASLRPAAQLRVLRPREPSHDANPGTTVAQPARHGLPPPRPVKPVARVRRLATLREHCTD